MQFAFSEMIRLISKARHATPIKIGEKLYIAVEILPIVIKRLLFKQKGFNFI